MLALLNFPACRPPARSCLAWQADCSRAGEAGGREPYLTGLVCGYWMKKELFFFHTKLPKSGDEDIFARFKRFLDAFQNGSK